MLAILSPVQAILKRPSMYVPNGSVEEILLYLDGYYMGYMHCKPEYQNIAKKSAVLLELEALGNWMSDSLGLEKQAYHYAFSAMTEAIHNKFQSDDEFFNAANQFLTAYEAKQKPSS